MDDEQANMNIVFFSDVHGMPSTLERLLKHAEALSAERLVFLGDALYHGPRNGVPDLYDPKRVAEILNAHKESIIAVRGNCDAEVDQMMLDFPIMADFSELVTPTRRFFLTHGHIWNEHNLPNVPPGTVLTHGHTRVPVIRELENGITLFNPGSISLPKNGMPQSFGFFNGKFLSVLRLEDGSLLI